MASQGHNGLTHWGRVTHICVSRLTITGSVNGLSPGRHQAIIWTTARILLIGPLGTNFSGNSIEILTFSFTKMRLKVSSAKWRPFCLGLNVSHGTSSSCCNGGSKLWPARKETEYLCQENQCNKVLDHDIHYLSLWVIATGFLSNNCEGYHFKGNTN